MAGSKSSSCYILLCEFERGGSNWEDIAQIDQIREAHAQKHGSVSRNWVKNEKLQKP